MRGALTNGASEEEIREVILQAATYCGMPAGMEGFRVAGKVVEEWRREREAKGEGATVRTDLAAGQRAAGEGV